MRVSFFQGKIAVLRAGSCLLAIGLASTLSTQASAQTASADSNQAEAAAARKAQAMDEIIVTGSRVRGVAPVGSAVTSLDAQDIANSGRTTLAGAIKELPQVFDLGVSENSRGQSGGAGNIVYSNAINLRGIGPSATLTLVDGHRVTYNSRSVDPSILPSLGVERIEVVPDGASAIYGSDAVAGVVNLIPRRSLDGAEMFARAGFADGNYHEYSGGVALGKVWDRGQVMLAYEHVEKSNLSGDDRGFFASDLTGSGGGDYRTTRCAPGTIRAGGTNYAIPDGGVTQANAGVLQPGTSNLCRDLQGQDLIPQQKYDSVNGTFTYELNDWLSVFADGFYSYRKFSRTPAYATATLTVPETNAFFVRPDGFTGSSYQLDYNFRNDVGRNVSSGHAESWQITPGVKVILPHDWEFEALVGHGKTSDWSQDTAGLNNGALNAALASSDPSTAFDPYGLGRTQQSVVDGIFSNIFIAPTVGHFTGYEARLNGTLFALPGGDVKMALGYEGQEFTVDLGAAIGAPSTPLNYRTFDRRVDSGYAQVIVPIFGPGNATPGFERLTLDAAVRYDKYSDSGSTTNPKFGIDWEPVNGLKLRGSYGTSFRAPSLTEIYGNGYRLYVQNYQNPNGGTPIVGVAISGGNPNLEPETATTWSVGADWEAAPGLKFSATYFDIDYKNKIIGLLSDLSVLTTPGLYDGTGLVLRGDAAGEQIAEYIAQGVPVAGAIPGGDPMNVDAFIDGRNQNLGRSQTRGIDFSANYSVRTDNAGTFGFQFGGTYLTDYKTMQTPNAPTVSRLNEIYQPLKFKARGSINWQSEFGLGVLLRVTHIGGYRNTAVSPSEKVASYTPVDLNITYRLFDQDNPLILGLEVRNLFDTNPPFVNISPSGNGGGGYDPTTTDPIGRLIAVSLRKSF